MRTAIRLCLFFGVLFGMTVSSRAAEPDELDSPVAVTVSDDGQTAYCSNLGGKDLESTTDRDGTGFISKLTSDGNIIKARFLPQKNDPPLNRPMGLGLTKNTLWVLDIDRLIAYDLSTLRQTTAIDLSKYGVEEAYSLWIEKALFFISDKSRNAVLSLELAPERSEDKKVSWFIPPGTDVSNLHGISFSLQRFHLLAACGKDGILSINMAGGYHEDDSVRMAFPPGRWSAVWWREPRLLAVDEESGSLWSWNQWTGKAERIADGLKRPGLFCVMADGKAALIPEMESNTVRKVALPAVLQYDDKRGPPQTPGASTEKK